MKKIIEIAKIQESDEGERIYVKNGYPKEITDKETIALVNDMVKENDELVVFHDKSFIEIVSSSNSTIEIQRGIKFIK